ncbi:MAG TPA: hypothetical protein VJ874_02915 [Candidatus Thermoplasmatota archaeon]|nr:hypothetical protein [Candidatus Thermoplasmatota archaeon]
MRRLELAAAWLSLAAGAVHAMAGPAHLAEWWAYGLFFFGAAAFQAAYGLLLFTRGIEGWGGWLAVRGKVYVGGIVFTAAIILVWVVSRTVGVPVGPDALEPEGIGVLDLTSKAVEAALLIALARLWWLAKGLRPSETAGGPP